VKRGETVIFSWIVAVWTSYPHKELKSIIRERQSKTGESYTAARAHVMRARTELLGLPEGSTTSDHKQRVEAIVLKVNQQSVRVRIPSENAQVTFRSSDASEVVPGHVVTLVVEKRWTWRGDAYASGAIENPRIAIAKLGLAPLPLHEFDLAYDLPYFPHIADLISCQFGGL
jgi:hypothetical protein